MWTLILQNKKREGERKKRHVIFSKGTEKQLKLKGKKNNNNNKF